MMETTVTDNPRLWRLNMLVEGNTLHAVMTSTVADSSLIYRRLPLDSSLPLHKALEETVYANPELLADFGKINILSDTASYTLVPDDYDGDAADIADITQIGRGNDIDIAVNADPSASGAKVIWTMPQDAQLFLARTFRNAPMRHTMTVLLTYLQRRGALSNRAKVFAHLRDGVPHRADIIAYDAAGQLRTATSKVWENDNDILYYTLAASRTASFDVETDELLLLGDNVLRHSVTPLLSRYVRHVMPMIFPSAALRAGKEAFIAPFPLIILPLCE